MRSRLHIIGIFAFWAVLMGFGAPAWCQDKAAEIEQIVILETFNGRIDLRALDNYAAPNIPDYISKRNSFDNPVTNAGATLGRVLFYDTSLSIDGTKSCGSCHVQNHAFGSPDILSAGVESGQTARHSMRLVNTLYAGEGQFFWDKRAANLKAQVLMPLMDHNEHGFSGEDGRPDLADLLERVRGTSYYRELFAFAFGEGPITEDQMASALAQFVNSMVSFDSKFDEGRALTGLSDEGRALTGLSIGDFPNYTETENLGKRLFMDATNAGGAGCNNCHNAPEFDIDPTSDHNGIVSSQDKKGIDITNTRSPSLRDLVAPDGSSNGPFMHDGSLNSLEAVIEHYNEISLPEDRFLSEFNRTMDPRLKSGDKPLNLDLSEIETQALVAFLKTLTGRNLYSDEKWSDPFPAK